MAARFHTPSRTGGKHMPVGKSRCQMWLPGVNKSAAWSLAASATVVMASILFAAIPAAIAQDLPHLPFIQPGGLPGLPVMLQPAAVTNGLELTWYAPSGYY